MKNKKFLLKACIFFSVISSFCVSCSKTNISKDLSGRAAPGEQDRRRVCIGFINAYPDNCGFMLIKHGSDGSHTFKSYVSLKNTNGKWKKTIQECIGGSNDHLKIKNGSFLSHDESGASIYRGKKCTGFSLVDLNQVGAFGSIDFIASNDKFIIICSNNKNDKDGNSYPSEAFEMLLKDAPSVSYFGDWVRECMDANPWAPVEEVGRSDGDGTEGDGDMAMGMVLLGV